MKLDWEEGWEERTRKDKTEWGSEKKSKKRESDKPLSRTVEQAHSGALRMWWKSGGRKVSYSWVRTRHMHWEQNDSKVEDKQRKRLIMLQTKHITLSYRKGVCTFGSDQKALLRPSSGPQNLFHVSVVMMRQTVQYLTISPKTVQTFSIWQLVYDWIAKKQHL